jgi:hypothetical protein
MSIWAAVGIALLAAESQFLVVLVIILLIRKLKGGSRG